MLYRKFPSVLHSRLVALTATPPAAAPGDETRSAFSSPAGLRNGRARRGVPVGDEVAAKPAVASSRTKPLPSKARHGVSHRPAVERTPLIPSKLNPSPAPNRGTVPWTPRTPCEVAVPVVTR